MLNTLEHNIHTYIETSASDYNYGIMLLAKVCRNKTLLFTLQKKESDYNREKLVYELDKYLTSVNYVEEFQEESVSENAIIPTKSPDIRANGPRTSEHKQKTNDLVSVGNSAERFISNHSRINDFLLGISSTLTVQRNALYASRDSYHGELHGARSDKRRYELAALIMPIQPKIDNLNIRINTIKTTGKLHEDDALIHLSNKDYNRVKNLNIYITRYNNKVSKATTVAEKTKHEKKVEALETEKQQILNIDE